MPEGRVYFTRQGFGADQLRNKHATAENSTVSLGRADPYTQCADDTLDITRGPKSIGFTVHAFERSAAVQYLPDSDR
jgi:hypothetical protein